MKALEPAWGRTSRFYLPNEDAAAIRSALGALDALPENPVFVGGSGMVLLEAARMLSPAASSRYVDIAAFQCAYFRRLRDALAGCATPAALRRWFARKVYPEMRGHFLARGREYALPQVWRALRDIFRCRFFFEQGAFLAARSAAGRALAAREDIAVWLAGARTRHDFIYLSNVPDYLDPEKAEVLFAACALHRAPTYVALTSACADQPAAHAAWRAAGFAPHACCGRLNALNRGLGSALRRDWNRPGEIFLLLP
ncbi:MAG: hypothetical protein LBO77_04015 [Desulfovibrio sp.]|nr:hypothetical protein [Desulfovibrio sp.]